MPIYTGIDIGSTEVRCVIAYAGNDASAGYSIAGVGIAPCQGVKKGIIVHPDEVAEALNHALEQAERQAGVNVSRATVLINGKHIRSQTSRGIIAINGANRSISVDDRRRVEDASMAIQLPANREIVQFFAKNYCINGEEIVKDPVGMQGVRLEVDSQIITVSTPTIRNTELTLGIANITPNNYSIAGLASAEAVLERRQKESGTAVIDMGAETTSIAILEDGEIEHVAVLPVGGQNITYDLAIGLRTSLDIAEKVKLMFTGFNDTTIGEYVVEHNGEKTSFDNSVVKMIIEARIDEILELIDKEFIRAKKSRKLPGGVVFVGGGSQLRGLVDIAKEKLALPATTGRIRGITGLVDKLRSTKMSAAVGAMMLDAILSHVDSNLSNEQKKWLPNIKILERIKRISNH